MLEDIVDTHSSTTEPCHQLLLSKLSKRPTLKERAAERRARGNGKLAQLDKNIMHLVHFTKTANTYSKYLQIVCAQRRIISLNMIMLKD